MHVLDLFSGLRGWSDPFKERGHKTLTVDNDLRFAPDICVDILTWDYTPYECWPDIILASPPCTGFTVMQIGRNWTREHEPKTDTARHGIALLQRTLDIIHFLKPKFWVLENPVGKMRKMPQLRHYNRETVTYCQYGQKRMKPTDLWGEFPSSWKPRPRCKKGAPCHIAAPRGSVTGTQGIGSAAAAKIPEELALEICEATERDF